MTKKRLILSKAKTCLFTITEIDQSKRLFHSPPLVIGGLLVAKGKYYTCFIKGICGYSIS